jgi:hypothetical protein
LSAHDDRQGQRIGWGAILTGLAWAGSVGFLGGGLVSGIGLFFGQFDTTKGLSAIAWPILSIALLYHVRFWKVVRDANAKPAPAKAEEP